MKKSKNTFKLNKQKIASLDKELKNTIKGGTGRQVGLVQTLFEHTCDYICIAQTGTSGTEL